MSDQNPDWKWDGTQEVYYYYDTRTRSWRRQDGQPYYATPVEDGDEKEEEEEEDEETPRLILDDGAEALASSQRERYSASPSSSRGTDYGSTSNTHYRYSSPTDVQNLTDAFDRSSLAERSPYAARGDQTPTPFNYAHMQREPRDAITDPELIKKGMYSRGKIRSTPGEVEPLDKGFKRQRDPVTFFVPGKVFRILWPEHPGPKPENVTVITDVGGMRGNDIITKFRWFVVVKSGTNFCSCLPISTYNRRGLNKGALQKWQHSIIYTGSGPRLLEGEEPEEGETGMMPPIRVVAHRRQDKMDPTSRLDYSRVYTVDHFVKVKNFGDVVAEDVKRLRKQWWIVFKENIKQDLESDVDDDDDEPKIKEWVTALYDYNENTDMMEMQEGDRIGVTDYTTDAWWKGINLRTNKEDLFPSNYVQRGLAATATET